MAVIAAMIFAWTSVFFTTAGQRLGVPLVNLLRLPGAALCLGVVHLAVFGRLWPANVTPLDQLWLGLSGVVGLAIGDSALFRAFTLIGPRRSMTMMALAPVVTVIMAWGLLAERLGPWSLTGIVVVIAGVILATRGRSAGRGRFASFAPGVLRSGILLASLAAVGQGAGSVLAKMGMTAAGGGVDPLGATLMRLTWAAAAYWLAVLPRLDLRAQLARLSDRRGTAALVVAILLGPFISVWISLTAIKHTAAGIAQVLLGMVPIFVVLPSWVVYRDRPAPASLVGIAVAVAGGALLFLR